MIIKTMVLIGMFIALGIGVYKVKNKIMEEEKDCLWWEA